MPFRVLASPQGATRARVAPTLGRAQQRAPPHESRRTCGHQRQQQQYWGHLCARAPPSVDVGVSIRKTRSQRDSRGDCGSGACGVIAGGRWRHGGMADPWPRVTPGSTRLLRVPCPRRCAPTAHGRPNASIQITRHMAQQGAAHSHTPRAFDPADVSMALMLGWLCHFVILPTTGTSLWVGGFTRVCCACCCAVPSIKPPRGAFLASPWQCLVGPPRSPVASAPLQGTRLGSPVAALRLHPLGCCHGMAR